MQVRCWSGGVFPGPVRLTRAAAVCLAGFGTHMQAALLQWQLHHTVSQCGRPMNALCRPSRRSRRLGAVCGCLGDCCRAEGDAAGTLRHYQDSVALLREAGQDPEVGSLGSKLFTLVLLLLFMTAQGQHVLLSGGWGRPRGGWARG